MLQWTATSILFIPSVQPPDLFQLNYLPAVHFSHSNNPGGYFVWIFQVFIWGDGADRLCLRNRAWCEALLTSLDATVLFRD